MVVRQTPDATLRCQLSLAGSVRRSAQYHILQQTGDARRAAPRVGKEQLLPGRWLELPIAFPSAVAAAKTSDR